MAVKKTIVTTTINAPTEAIRKYDSMKDWNLIVTGDTLTPEYRLQNGRFMSWTDQKIKYPKLCALIGPDSVARGRMIAFLEAWEEGADIVATIDDDCDPYPNWGQEIHLGKVTRTYYCKYSLSCGFSMMDPQMELSAKQFSRGFPLEIRSEYLKQWYKTAKSRDKETIPIVQANMSDGQKDLDAFARLYLLPYRAYTRRMINGPISFAGYAPFNTQNTMVHREAKNHYLVNIPFCGRMDDIWASYLLEYLFPGRVLFDGPTVCHDQNRTIKSIIRDLKDEFYGYENNFGFLKMLSSLGMQRTMNTFIPDQAQRAIECYLYHATSIR